MFEAGRNTDEATLACAGESDLAAAASTFTRLEYQSMARKVLAYHLGVKVFDRVMAADYDRYRKKMPDKAAVRDVAWHFAVPPATAGRWMTLGELLSSLPKIRAAFLDGDLSESRASLLAHAVIALDETQYGAAEDAALGYAAEATTNSVLSELLDEMVIALDPDRAEQARHAYAARTQDVRFRKDLYGQVNISATLDLVDARTLQARLTAMIEHFLCRNDTRPPGQQRADALAAFIHDHTTLDCRCGDPHCTAPANQPPDDDESEPGTPTSDANGDAAEDAHSDEDTSNEGVSDDEDADGNDGHREDSDGDGDDSGGCVVDADIDADATTLDIDVDAPLPEEPDQPDDPEPEPQPSTEIAPRPVRVVVEVVTDAPTLAGLTGDMVPYIKGYGAIDPAHARELAANGTWQGMYRESQRFAHHTDPTQPDQTFGLLKPGRTRTAGTIIVPTHLTTTDGGTGSIVVRSRPPNPQPIDTTGHGGLTTPPPGALIYAPRRRERSERARCHSRYCGAPSPTPTTTAADPTAADPWINATSTTSCPSTTKTPSQVARPSPRTSTPCASPATNSNTSASGHPPWPPAGRSSGDTSNPARSSSPTRDT
jgi:hypothetical protein